MRGVSFVTKLSYKKIPSESSFKDISSVYVLLCPVMMVIYKLQPQNLWQFSIFIPAAHATGVPLVVGHLNPALHCLQLREFF